MRVFRLSNKKYTIQLSGKGASKSGNRWNSKGTEIIYSVESRALAMAEVAVNLTLSSLPNHYVMIEIDIPDTVKIKELKLKDLPQNWNTHPPNISTQRIGDEFIEKIDICVLKVPSPVVPGDSNYLINPHHKEFKKIKIFEVKDFPFDKRMYR